MQRRGGEERVAAAEPAVVGGDAPSAMTVARALELRSLKHGLPEILAGAENLDREVRWVHVTEDPNVGHTLKGGELMLSTGRGLEANRRAAIAFVRELDERRAAGLVIELGEPMPVVPDWLVREARAVGLPLICLNREVAFVEVTEAMHSEIVSHQLEVFRRGQELHDRFAALVVEGKDVTDILAAVAGIVGNPVVLEDHRGGLLFHANHGLDDRDIIAAWQSHQQGLAAAPALEVPVARSGAGGGGRLIVLGLTSPFGAFDGVALDRAAGVIALALVRTHQDLVIAARERGNFLIEVIEGRLNPREAGLRAQALGFRSELRALMPVAVSVGALGRHANNDIWDALRRELDGAGFITLIAGHQRIAEIVIVVALQHPDRRPNTADRLATLIAKVVERQASGSRRPVVAIGATCDWTTLGATLLETGRAAEAGRDLPERAWHDAAAPDLERLLWSLARVPDVSTFVELRLSPLIEQDKRRNSALIATLEAFCESGGRKTAAAEALHLRRQALHYRLSRIEELIGADLGDEDTRLGLHLALRLRRYLEPSG